MGNSAELVKGTHVEPTRGDPQPVSSSGRSLLHPAWCAFMRFCMELGHGEIEQLKIQDGLPVLAEMTKKKVKFT